MIATVSWLTILGMLVITYSTRLLGVLLLRNKHTIGKKMAKLLEVAPGCVLVSVIAPYFVSGKPHELAAAMVAVFAAWRFGMMITVLVSVGTAALLGRLWG